MTYTGGDYLAAKQAPREPRKRAALWTEPDKIVLTTLWALGRPASEIARTLGCSRDAVLGMRLRMKLPGRPSPIGGHYRRDHKMRRDFEQLAKAAGQ
jgi:hypothetical protein